MDKIQMYIAIATSVITFVTLIYNSGLKKGQKREKEYYEKILQPYIVELSKNSDIKALETVKEYIKRDDDNIPKYVIYLVDNNREDDLKAILIYDYFHLYPNDDNNLDKIADSLSKIMYYIIFIMSLIFLFLGIVSFVIGAFSIVYSLSYEFVKNNIVEEIAMTDWKLSLKALIYGVLGVGMCKIFVYINKLINLDRYDLKKKKIEKLIKKKLKKFKNEQEKYIY